MHYALFGVFFIVGLLCLGNSAMYGGFPVALRRHKVRRFDQMFDATLSLILAFVLLITAIVMAFKLPWTEYFCLGLIIIAFIVYKLKNKEYIKEPQ